MTRLARDIGMIGSKLIPWVVLGAGVVSVAVALVYFYGPSLNSPPTAEQVPAAQPAASQAETPAEQQPKPQAEATGALEPPSKPMTVPSFDVVLVEPSGEGVLAGRAEPGWSVSVESGGTKVAEATADEQGEWSIVLEKPLPAGDHALSLKTTSPDGTRALSSQQTVSVAVANAETKEVAALPQAEKPAPPAASEEPPKEPPGAVAAAPQAEAARPAPAPPAEAPKTEAAEPAPAPQIAEVETGGKPAGAQSAGAGEPSPSPPAPGTKSEAPSPSPPQATIVIRTVDYQDTGADTGKMKLAGTSDPGAAIQLYFDDKPFANAIADRAGRWSAETDMKLGAGQHTFRAERYDETTHLMAGQAVVTIERRAPQVAAKAPPPTAPAPAPSEAKPGETAPSPAASPQVAAVETGTAEAAPERIAHHKKARSGVYTIRPGDTLWDIAKRYLGGGWRYTSIYHGNRHVIRDPDRIVPQQKVKMPKR
ncbi:MAG TPA: Ig-like domain-containing protein [Methyloceanibacter sp.]|nr:Ig-like domain-containing protein [Methyloceanibacter sp.]